MKRYYLYVVLIVVITLAIRIIAARDAYPCPGDGGHFVQHGIEYAHGNANAMSALWSQGMVWVSSRFANCSHLRYYGLQYLNVIMGTIVILASMLLAKRLFDARASLVVGLLSACNPSLVRYSINSYSEIPFIALGMLALCCLCWSRNSLSTSYSVLAGLLLGIGGLFRILDAFAWMCAFLFVVILWKNGRFNRKIIFAFIMLFIFCLGVLPVVKVTYDRTGKFGLGSKAPGNFALGPDMLNSKCAYGIRETNENNTREQASDENIRTSWEREVIVDHSGILTYILKNPSTIAKRLVYNGLQAYKYYVGFIFMKGFRLGAILSAILVSFVGLYARKYEKRIKNWVPLVIVITIVSISVCMNFVIDRFLLECLPSLLIIVASVLVVIYDQYKRSGKYGFAICLSIYIFVCLRYSLAGYRDEIIYWRYENLAQVGVALRPYINEHEIVMCYGPHLLLHALPEHPLNERRLPYADASEVEKRAINSGTTMIAISSVWRSHWPIAKVFANESILEGWRPLITFSCDGDDENMVPEEKIMIMVRQMDDRMKLPDQQLHRRRIRDIL